MTTAILEGHVSGTGSVTLKSPNTNTDYVLDLPAVTGTVLAGPVSSTNLVEATSGPSASAFSMRNKLINGDMRIDQRNSGAAVTIGTSQYTVDRWNATGNQASKYTVQQNAGSVTPPTGFSKYLGVTSLSAYSVLVGDFNMFYQKCEGQNVADLDWGTASAKTVTLSFKVRSSLTGTFGGAITNGAQNRSYPFSYSIPVANTWTSISVTIPGDTSGTWATDNTASISVFFGLGIGTTYSGTAGAWAGTTYYSATGAVSVVGTNAATFYITGVQLEAGSVATPFETRPYGMELALCQRYYLRLSGTAGGYSYGMGSNDQTSSAAPIVVFPVPMRTSPTALEQSGTATDYNVKHGVTTTACNSVPTFIGAGTYNALVRFTTTAVLTVGQAGYGLPANGNAYLGFSAEL